MTVSSLTRYGVLPLFFGFALGLLSTNAGAQQIAIAPSTLAFGNVIVGKGETRAVRVTNKGTLKLVFTDLQVSGSGYAVNGLKSGVTLAPGESAHLEVTFTPSLLGADKGSVIISTQAWGYHRKKASSTVTFSGAGVKNGSAGTIAASPANLKFGNLSPGGSQTLNETLTNTGGTSVTLSQASMSSPAFKVSGMSLPATLASGHSLTFSVVFAPGSSGVSSGDLLILSTASNPRLNIALSGSETVPGQLTVVPSTLNFGTVPVGSKVSLSGTLSATGSAVTVSSMALTSGEFTVSGISPPLNIPAGHSIPFTLTFMPQSSGTATAALAFVSNAAKSPATESLVGSGSVTAQHSVTLSWAASPSTDVVGYKIYRSGTSGGPYAQITSAAGGSVSYIDNAVNSGKSYFYVVTAVAGGGVESAYSNQAQATIPIP